MSEEISRKYTPQYFAKQPNLVLLPVDPEHLYASWDRFDAQLPLLSSKVNHEVVLRIYPNSAESTTGSTSENWFDVSIESAQTRQKVFVPIAPEVKTYQAVLGKREQGDQFTEMLISKIVKNPRNTYWQSSVNVEMAAANNEQPISSNQVKSDDSRINASDPSNN